MVNQLIFSTEQHVFIYDQYLLTQSASQVRRFFETRFPGGKIPWNSTVRNLYKKFDLLVPPTWPPAISISRVDWKILCTWVTGISLCTANALSAGNGQRRIATTTHSAVIILQIAVDGGAGTVHLRCPYILAPLYKISHNSLYFSSIMLLISSRILSFSSSRVHGFVLYMAFFNLPHCLKFVIQNMNCWTRWNFYTRESCFKESSYLAGRLS